MHAVKLRGLSVDGTLRKRRYVQSSVTASSLLHVYLTGSFTMQSTAAVSSLKVNESKSKKEKEKELVKIFLDCSHTTTEDTSSDLQIVLAL